MKRDYDTLSQAINGLKKMGYTEDFNLKDNGIESKASKYEIPVKDFYIDQMFRFEGMTNPADASILYAISSEKFKVKGLLVDAYGVYGSTMTTEMVEKLRYRP